MRVVPAGLVLLLVGAVACRGGGRAATSGGAPPLLAVFNFGLFFPLLVVAVYRLPGGVAAAVGGLQPLLVAGLTVVARPAAARGRGTSRSAWSPPLGVGLSSSAPAPGSTPSACSPPSAPTCPSRSASCSPGGSRRRPTGSPPPAGSCSWAAPSWCRSPLVVEGAPPAVTGRTVLGFAYLSLVGTALAFVLWFNGIRRLPAAAPPLLGLAAPVTGAVHGLAGARPGPGAGPARRLRRHAGGHRLRRHPASRRAASFGGTRPPGARRGTSA